MSETSGFFEAEYDSSTSTYDREYLASQFANYFKLFIGNGVFVSPTNQLKVSAGEGMHLNVASGWAFINGYWYNNSDVLSLTVPSNSSGSSRTDSVRARYDEANRKISIQYVAGSVTPTRTDLFYDIILAEVVIPSGSSQVLAANITDARSNEAVCGFVSGLFDIIGTDDLFSQLEAVFNAWFDTVKDQVTGDLAIRLQQEFTQLNEDVEEYYESTTTDIANYKSSMDATVAGYKTSSDNLVTQYKNSTDQTIASYQQEVSSIASGAVETADDADEKITTFVNNDFIIPKQALTFINRTCIITDSRVTATSLVDVYFTSEATVAAESAIIYVDSQAGKIVLTAENQPTGSLEALIRVRVM